MTVRWFRASYFEFGAGRPHLNPDRQGIARNGSSVPKKCVKALSSTVYDVMSFSVYEVTRFHPGLQEQKYLQALFCTEEWKLLHNLFRVTSMLPNPDKYG